MRVDWKQHRAFIYGTWEPEVVNALREVVQEGFVAIDIGAHVGFYALVLARLVGPRGRVIAFEPLPSNFRVLEENTRLNACDHVLPVNRAILDRSCSLEVTTLADNPLSGSISLFENRTGEAVLVEGISLDDFLGEKTDRVDFIQMDVEGAEDLVLAGARKTIELHHPIILVEVHHFDRRLDASSVPSRLAELGYELRWLSKWEYTSHVLAIWKGASSCSNT
jgi:FkbM family methyltransferase